MGRILVRRVPHLDEPGWEAWYKRGPSGESLVWRHGKLNITSSTTGSSIRGKGSFDTEAHRQSLSLVVRLAEHAVTLLRMRHAKESGSPWKPTEEAEPLNEANTEKLRKMEMSQDKYVPAAWVSALSTNKQRRVTLCVHTDLYDWSENDISGYPQEDQKATIVEDIEEADVPVSVCDVDESTFIASLLRRQGYDATGHDVSRWLKGDKPPVDVATALKSIKTNLGYLVRAAQAESIVTGMFASMGLGSIIKEEPFERKMQSSAELRSALGERTLQMKEPLRLPRRYELILEQLSRAVRLEMGEYVNLWLERSIEVVLMATRIKTRYDDLGLTAERRKLFNFTVNHATIKTTERPAVVTTDER